MTANTPAGGAFLQLLEALVLCFEAPCSLVRVVGVKQSCNHTSTRRHTPGAAHRLCCDPRSCVGHRPLVVSSAALVLNIRVFEAGTLLVRRLSRGASPALEDPRGISPSKQAGRGISQPVLLHWGTFLHPPHSLIAFMCWLKHESKHDVHHFGRVF